MRNCAHNGWSQTFNGDGTAGDATCLYCGFVESELDHAIRGLRKFDGHNYKPSVYLVRTVLGELEALRSASE